MSYRRGRTRRLPGLAWVALLLSLLPVAMGRELDATLLNVCQELASDPGNGALRTLFTQHPNVAKMKEGMGEDFRISFEQIEQNRERIAEFRRLLPGLRRKLPKLADDASAFLGPGAIPAAQRINIVCGGPFDGYGLRLGDTTELFLDVTLTDPGFVESLVRHELWHIGFKTRYRAMFEREFQATAPLRRLAYQLLNEGVGHYYSFQRRVEPEIDYDDWALRTQKIFALLDRESARLASAETRELQDEMIWSSHVGVPFWQKWGAVPGAVITYRLRKHLGDEEVATLISTGPCGFLGRYNDAVTKNPSWEAVPPRVVHAACEGPAELDPATR